MVKSNEIKSARKKLLHFLFVRYQIHGFLWLLPAIVLMVMFILISQIWAFLYSFSDWGVYLNITFTGVENYARAFQDALYWKSYGNVLIFTFFGVLFSNTGCVLLVELLFNLRSKRVSAFYKFMFLLPSIVPGIVGVMVWTKVIFLPASGTRIGVANALMRLLGLKELDWYYSVDTVILTYILTGAPWLGGPGVLICLAALQEINSEVIDASQIDGVGKLKRVFYIDIPLIKPNLKYFIVTGVIGGIQNYSLQLILGTDLAMVPGYYIYSWGVANSEYGYACSLGVLMFVIILTLTRILNRFMRTEDVR